MADTAAHFVDRVIPEAPVRQWVLSLPRPLRYFLAYDAALLSDVLGVWVRVVLGWVRRRARGGRGGAVTFVQRFGSAMNLNVHFHTVALDGTYDGNGFRAIAPPTDREAARLCERRGRWPEDAREDPLAEEEPLLAAVAGASIQGAVATGERAGSAVERLGDRIDAEDVDEAKVRLRARVAGFSVHAGVCVPARDRKRLEHLVRYVARPPVTGERLTDLGDGTYAYELKRRWSDGTTHIRLTGVELMEKLCALMPRPQANLVRYHGVFAARAKLRPMVVADRRRPATPPGADAPAREPAPPVPPDRWLPRDRYLSWRDLAKRVFEADVLACGNCGGEMKVIAALTGRAAITKYLRGVGVDAELPAFAPARAPPPGRRRRRDDDSGDDDLSDALFV